MLKKENKKLEDLTSGDGAVIGLGVGAIIGMACFGVLGIIILGIPGAVIGDKVERKLR